MLAFLTFVAALSAPATVLAHGIAHAQESSAHHVAGHPDDAYAHAPSAGAEASGTLAVESADSVPEHPALHPASAVYRLNPSAAPLPTPPEAEFGATTLTGASGVEAIAESLHASAPDDPISQPRAPPLG